MRISSPTSRFRALPILATAIAALALAAPAALAQQQPAKRHALSLVGEPKFPPDYKSFDWANVSAPKAGVVKMWSEGSFDNLNSFTMQGEAADQLDLIYDHLMSASPDEPSTSYGLIAEWVSYPADYSSVTFGLRANARFHDGKPVTPEDAIFSLEAQKKANPRILHYYKNVVRGEKTGERQVTFHFDAPGNRELPQIVGGLTIIPKHYWEGKNDKGEQRDLSKAIKEMPLGSGPYKIKEVDPGRAITYERVADWWAKDLPIGKGQWNFEQIRIDYYRERTVAFEAFKSGKIDFWPENSAKSWATEYEFPAVKKGWVKLEKVPSARVSPMQSFGFNLRRSQFSDIRVRRAFIHAFNFEAMNEQLLYSQYFRTSSYFDNSELKSTGLPQGRELEILKEVQKDAPGGSIPPEVFTAEYKNPVGGSDTVHRRNLAEASKLLREAGWTLQGTQLRKDGQPLKVEILLGSATFERHSLRYIDDLKKLGIDATLRTVDSAQYTRRIRSFDYDMILASFPQTISPGNEQRAYWTTESGAMEGGRNVLGIKNPAVDKLVDKVIFAKDRAELVQATRALDRVLLWNAYVVPQWHYPFDRMAYWDKYRHLEKLPSQNPSFDRAWWYDAAADKDLEARRAQ